MSPRTLLADRLQGRPQGLIKAEEPFVEMDETMEAWEIRLQMIWLLALIPRTVEFRIH